MGSHGGSSLRQEGRFKHRWVGETCTGMVYRSRLPLARLTRSRQAQAIESSTRVPACDTRKRVPGLRVKRKCDKPPSSRITLTLEGFTQSAKINVRERNGRRYVPSAVSCVRMPPTLSGELQYALDESGEQPLPGEYPCKRGTAWGPIEPRIRRKRLPRSDECNDVSTRPDSRPPIVVLGRCVRPFRAGAAPSRHFLLWKIKSVVTGVVESPANAGAVLVAVLTG